MKTMTSSHETLPSPQPRRRTNRFVYWAGRILLGLLALHRRFWRRAARAMRRSWLRRRQRALSASTASWWMLAATACICTASGRAARPWCSMPGWARSPSIGVQSSPRSPRQPALRVRPAPERDPPSHAGPCAAASAWSGLARARPEPAAVCRRAAYAADKRWHPRSICARHALNLW